MDWVHSLLISRYVSLGLEVIKFYKMISMLIHDEIFWLDIQMHRKLRITTKTWKHRSFHPEKHRNLCSKRASEKLWIPNLTTTTLFPFREFPLALSEFSLSSTNMNLLNARRLLCTWIYQLTSSNSSDWKIDKRTIRMPVKDFITGRQCQLDTWNMRRDEQFKDHDSWFLDLWGKIIDYPTQVTVIDLGKIRRRKNRLQNLIQTEADKKCFIKETFISL